MAGELEIVKAIAPFAAPLTAAVVETWIKPKLIRLHKYLKIEKALFENVLTSKFDEYLQRAYEKNSYTNVIVFQNQQKRLSDIYIPLTVVSERLKNKILINSYEEEFIPTYQKVLISDTAGMGKSTILKYLFLSCIERNEGVPILIELRKLKGDESIVSYIYNELNPINSEIDEDLVLNLIKQGGFVFFFDGYDEIPFGERSKVTNNLHEFISKAGNNLFVLFSFCLPFQLRGSSDRFSRPSSAHPRSYSRPLAS